MPGFHSQTCSQKIVMIHNLLAEALDAGLIQNSRLSSKRISGYWMWRCTLGLLDMWDFRTVY
jgi:hypothetical protein